MKKQQLPDWFKGNIYEEGDTVKNPTTNEYIELNNVELSLYDCMIGGICMIESGMRISNADLKEIKDGLEWFKANNNEVYKFLLSQTGDIKL